MKPITQGVIHMEYDLLLVDENIKDFPNDNHRFISASSMEFVPQLNQDALNELFRSKAGIHSLYFSYDPSKLIAARECGIDTCFLNNGINDTIDFEKTYEIPYTKRLTLKHSTNK